MATQVCEGCGEPIEGEDDLGGHVDHEGEDWHEYCFQFGANGPKYCCGMIYEDGESTCRSCGEPL